MADLWIWHGQRPYVIWDVISRFVRYENTWEMHNRRIPAHNAFGLFTYYRFWHGPPFLAPNPCYFYPGYDPLSACIKICISFWRPLLFLNWGLKLPEAQWGAYVSAYICLKFCRPRPNSWVRIVSKILNIDLNLLRVNSFRDCLACLNQISSYGGIEAWWHNKICKQTMARLRA